jgi:hypothetical protein
MYVCMYVCTYVRMYVCMCMYVCVYIYIYLVSNGLGVPIENNIKITRLLCDIIWY